MDNGQWIMDKIILTAFFITIALQLACIPVMHKYDIEKRPWLRLMPPMLSCAYAIFVIIYLLIR